MSKLKRTNKDYGGAAGRGVFSSPLFDVYLMSSNVNGKFTQLKSEMIDSYEITFDGDQTEYLKNDKQCLEQFAPNQILQMIKMIRKTSFRDGEISKQAEIKAALGVRGY